MRPGAMLSFCGIRRLVSSKVSISNGSSTHSTKPPLGHVTLVPCGKSSIMAYVIQSMMGQARRDTTRPGVVGDHHITKIRKPCRFAR